MAKASDIHTVSDSEKQKAADILADTDPTDALNTGAGQVGSPYQNEVQAEAIAKQTKKRNDPID